jgi:hypothetical protein
VHANFRHLTGHSRHGMTLGFYVAVIAVLLMYQYTGRPVNKYAYNLLSLVAAGMATPDQALAILDARERRAGQRPKDRRRPRRPPGSRKNAEVTPRACVRPRPRARRRMRACRNPAPNHPTPDGPSPPRRDPARTRTPAKFRDTMETRRAQRGTEPEILP